MASRTRRLRGNSQVFSMCCGPWLFPNWLWEPVFETEEIVLEGDLVIKGHVRLVHLAYVGLKLLFDKNLKHLRQRLKE